MENSILNSTKKVLGIAADYDVFDDDIMMMINSTFASVNQLGIGPADTFQIEGDIEVWDALLLPRNQTNMIKTYVFLKCRLMFDPPTTSFLIDATKKQIEEHEWRLSAFRENEVIAAQKLAEEQEEVIVYDGY